MRFIFCTFYILVLSGCQSFIAYQITQPVEEISFDGMENMIIFSGAPTHSCITDLQCLDFRLFSQSDLNKHLSEVGNLNLSLVLKSNNKTEEFKSELDLSNQATSNSSNVIVLFPGYGVNSMGYSFQARWLSHFTGKDVILMPASNQYNEFKFGLNSLGVLQHYLNNNQYQQIDILSYSMGSIAAMQFAKQMSNVKQQIMVAPIVHFDTALMSVAKNYHPTLSYFVKDNDFKNAAKNVIQNSGIDETQLDLFALLNSKQSVNRTTLYVSNADPISPADYWQALQNKSVSVVHYSNLNHTRMVSLINQAMRNEVLHRLM